MATKVNTKFVMILVLTIGLAGAIVVGLGVLKARGSVERNIRAGDEAFARGDYQTAFNAYGRAAHKDQGNLRSLRKLEDTVLRMVPQTDDRAQELYGTLLGILRNRAEHDNQNPESHLELLREAYDAARMVSVDPQRWELQEIAATAMLDSLPQDDPNRIQGQIFKAMATLRLAAKRSEEQLAKAEQELRDVLKQQPTNDLAWSALVMGHWTICTKLLGEGKSRTEVDQQVAKLDQALAEALTAVPEGPEVARVHLERLLLDPWGARRPMSKEVADATRKLARLLTPDVDQNLFAESVSLMFYVPNDAELEINGWQLSIELLERYLQAHPDALDKRVHLARVLYLDNRLDRAEQLAQEVVASEQLPTSLMSWIQFHLRQMAASLIVDVEAKRLLTAAPADKGDRLKGLEAARARLAALVSDPSTDASVMRADGKIAFAKGEYKKANTYFDRLIRNDSTDWEILLYSAECLEQIGQVGGAHERIATAVSISPQPVLVMKKAELEFRMGRFGEAKATLAALPETERQKPQAVELAAMIQSKVDAPVGVQPQDPIVAALMKADKEFTNGEVETARATLLSVLETAPDDARVLEGLTHLEMKSGQSAKAHEYVDRALKLYPGQGRFLRLKALIEHSDPITAIREYLTSTIEKETTRDIALMQQYGAVSRQNDLLATQLEGMEDSEGAAKARELATRAKTQAQAYEERVKQHSPDDLGLLDYQFQTALHEKDWERAEEVTVRAKALNADQADGLLYRGHYQLAREEAKEAVRTLEDATSRLRFSAPAWRTLGWAYKSIGNDDQAIRAYEEAYKCNPTDIQSAREFVVLLLRNNLEPRALRILQTLHRLAPQDAALRDTWLDLEARIGDQKTALQTRRTIYKENPDDRLNARRLAQVLGQLEPTRELIVDAQGNPVHSEQRWLRMTPDERTRVVEQARADWRAESDGLLSRIAAEGGDDLQLAFLRAALLLHRGMVDEGEELLRQYIASHPDPTQMTSMLLELARYQTMSSHFAEARQTLLEAIKHQDPTQREADRELGRLAMQLGAHQEAIEHLRQVLEVRSDAAIQHQVVECLVKLKKFDEAEKALSEIKDGDPYLALMLRGAIAEGRADELYVAGNKEGAKRQYVIEREALAQAEALKPTSPQPRVFLAQSLVQEYRQTKDAALLDQAMEALRRAEEIRADTQIDSVRVLVLKEKGDRRGLILHLRRMLESQPANVLVRKELVQALVQDREVDAALAVIDEAIKLNPTLAMWQDFKGDLFKVARSDASAALTCFLKADELAPTSLSLVKVVDAAFAVQPPDCKGIAARLAARPNDLAAAPILRESYARALNCAGRRSDALEQARLAYAQRQELIRQGKAKPHEISGWFQLLTVLFMPADNSGNFDAAAAEQFVTEVSGGQTPDVYQAWMLAKMWMLPDDPTRARAIELQRQAIAACPPEDKALLAQLQVDLGDILMVSGRPVEAAAAYEAVISLNPNSVRALNNLAYVVAEDLKDPARALPYAERVAQLSPKDASILDTAGWVSYLAGNVSKAREYLELSLNIDPKGQMPHLHLAEVLIKGAEYDRAEHLLKEVEKQDIATSIRQKVAELRNAIGKARTGAP